MKHKIITMKDQSEVNQVANLRRKGKRKERKKGKLKKEYEKKRKK